MTPPELLQLLRQANIRVSPGGYLRAAAVAQFIGVTTQTLLNWREAGKPPRSIRLNGQHFYTVAALAEFLDESKSP